MAEYIHGWEAFKERVKEYPLDKVEQITWVDEDLIREAARMYATTKPAGIHWGVPTEQTINCTDFTRTAIGLMAATGNLDAPGGNVFHVPPKVRKVSEFSRHDALTPSQREKRLGGDQYKLAARMALITPKVAWDAMVTGKPYPLKAGIFVGTNPVITEANAKDIYAALKKLDFLAVADFFLTPTAELADIFLPAGTWLEQNHMAENWKFHGYVLARQKVVEIGECWQDHKIFQELGKRMGQEWWDTVEDALDYLLEPTGLTWEQFKEKGYLKGDMVYYKYRQGRIFDPHPEGGALLHHSGRLGKGPSPEIYGDPGKPGFQTRSGQGIPLHPQCRVKDPDLFSFGQPPGPLAAGDPARSHCGDSSGYGQETRDQGDGLGLDRIPQRSNQGKGQTE